MSELTTWLLAVLDEDWAVAEQGPFPDARARALAYRENGWGIWIEAEPAWIFADITAKRAIVTTYRDLIEGPPPATGWLSGQLKAYSRCVRHIALSYAARTGYDERWWL